MGRELGRISGPLLAENLLRNGQNLAFDTKVLFLDVVNKRVGFNNEYPVTDLYTPTDIRTTNLIVDNLTDIGNFNISGNQIQDALSTITIVPPTVISNLGTSQLNFVGNSIKSLANASIELTPNGSGVVNFNKDLNVNASLHATGNITFDGNVQLGDQTTDTINFIAEVNTSILPTGNHNLGSANNQWQEVYSPTVDLTTLTRSSLTVTTLNVGDIRINSNNIYNSAGNDLNLAGNGAGFVNINGAGFAGNNIYTPTDATLTLSTAGSGYVKFTGSNGLVLANGSNSNYPITPEPGTVRFNTDLNYPEVYDTQAGWIPISGTPITADEVVNTSELWSLILGL